MSQLKKAHFYDLAYTPSVLFTAGMAYDSITHIREHYSTEK